MGLIERPGLVAMVEARPVTVLAGVAGYGKSTLLAAAAARRPGGSVWLTLDDTEKDPVRFVGDLVTATAVAGIEPLADQVERLRVSSLRAEPLSLVDSLLEALYDSAEPHLLVLDDLQHLAGSGASTTIVDHLLRWAPANLKIAMAARVVPPLRLQRLRLEDRLTYLAHDDLAFSLDESAAAVRAAQLDLDPSTVTTIQQATDGWPAGVRMAILAARHRGTATDVSLELRRDRALADYLATEVLASLAPELRDFVLESSLDDQVCPSLVDAVRGTGTAEAFLETCVGAGLFISRGVSGPQGQWYQWHPLFAAHTQRRLAAEHPDRAARLHASSASWWSGVDSPTAIGHALAAGDGEAASRIFSESWLELLLQGRVDAVLSVVDRLPRVSAYGSDAHLAKALVSVQRGETSLARAELDAARASMGALGELERTRLHQRTALVDLLVTGCEHGLGEVARVGGAMLEERAEGTALDPVVLASVRLLVGMGESRVQQHVETALEMLHTSARTAGAAGLAALELTALAESCIPAITEGALTEAHDRAEDVLAKAAAQGWVGLATLAPAVVYLGWLDYWRGNLHEARAQLERGLSMLLPFDWELRGLALHFHAKTCLALGDLTAARVSVAQIAILIDAGGAPAWWPRMLAAVDGLLLWAERKPGRAVDLVLKPPAGPDYPAAPALRATVLLRAGRPAEALSELERADSDTASAIPIQVQCLSYCLEAEALAVLGKEEAHLALEKALAAAAPDGLFGPFLCAGGELTALLKKHLSHGTSHPEVVTRVLGRLAEPGQHHATAWSEQLTDREHVILRYLATNLTNTEIADAEFISVHTTKTHIAHIYRKLGVNNRRSAIRRAAELDLY